MEGNPPLSLNFFENATKINSIVMEIGVKLQNS